MSEILVNLMLNCGATLCDDTDMIVSEEELVQYTNTILSEKDKELARVKNDLFIAQSQLSIYRSVVNDSH